MNNKQLEQQCIQAGLIVYEPFGRTFNEAVSKGKDFYITEQSGRIVRYHIQDGDVIVQDKSS